MSQPIPQPNLTIQEARDLLAQQYQQQFPRDYFFREPHAQPGVFEIGMCFAGSVSAGAYLAGVADFLIEALDAWEKAKAVAPADVPNHAVRLSTFSGASGGGMTALILGASLDRRVVPARAGNSPTPTENPLYAAWVKGIDIKLLLRRSDLQNEHVKVQSFLDSSRITELAAQSLIASGPPQPRAYVAQPLHIGVTIGNLNGFAHQFGLRSSTSYGYRARVHEDVVRFAFRHGGGGNAPATDLPALPHERLVDLAQRPQSENTAQWPAAWRLVAQAATATGAFPAGLLPRDVLRDWPECDPRILPMERGANGKLAVLPTLHGPAPISQYSCLSVDGGTFNNEPFEVARTNLAGLLGQNPRAGQDAKRAVIMVDPLVLPDEDAYERLRPEDTVLNVISGIVFRAFKNQARTHLTDWTAALAEDIYSRYLLTPTKGNQSGDEAICGSVLGAFGGFLCEAYREHDFRLGRRNCQKFLRDHFALPSSNALFNTWSGNTALVQRYGISDDSGDPAKLHLPIIPLVGDVRQEELDPSWPSPQEFQQVRDDIYERAEKRIDAIYTI